MTVSDPISDMLTRIRNAILAGHDTASMPASKIKIAIAKVLKEEGFITDYSLLKGKPQRVLKIQLRYLDNKSVISGLERVSKPSLRVYVKKNEIPRVYGGLGVAIVSTPKGVVVGKAAWRQGLGGELLCYVW